MMSYTLPSEPELDAAAAVGPAHRQIYSDFLKSTTIAVDLLDAGSCAGIVPPTARLARSAVSAFFAAFASPRVRPTGGREPGAAPILCAMISSRNI